MNQIPFDDTDIPPEIDFSNGVRGIHNIKPGWKVFLPASIEKSIWDHFSSKAAQTGVDLSRLVSDTLKRDIESDKAPR